MKKINLIVSVYLFFVGFNLVFSQNCVNNVDIGFNSGFELIGTTYKTAVVRGTTNDFVVAGRIKFNNSLFLQKYNFTGANPCNSPTVDNGVFQTNVTSAANPTSMNSQRLKDIEAYDTDLFTVLGTGARNYVSLIDNNGAMRSFVYNIHTYDEGIPNDIACDVTNQRIYCVYVENSNITIRIYRVMPTDLLLIGISSFPYAGFTITDPKIELIPNATQGSERLLLTYNLNATGRLSLLQPVGYNPTFTSDDATYTLATQNSFTGNGVGLQMLSTTNAFPNNIRALEYNDFNDRVYLGGGDMQTNHSKVTYFSYNSQTDALTQATNFNSICSGGYVTSLDFLADCKIVIGGAFSGQNYQNPTLACPLVGNSFIIDGDTGTVIGNAINNSGQINDIAVYNSIDGQGNLCESFFGAGNQGMPIPPQPNVPAPLTSYFTRYCVSTINVSSSFDYCKTNNQNGTYNVVINNSPANAVFAYTLNGIPVNNLNNLNGTLVITATTPQSCSILSSCYQETITNGNNCAIVDRMTQPSTVVLPIKDKDKPTEIIKGKTVIVYPNPSEGIFTIKGNFNPSQNVEIDVYDLMAKSVLKKTIANFNNDGEDLDLKNQSSGTYIISITQGTSKITHTIIKE